MKLIFIIMFIFIVVTTSTSSQFYVAPNGSDTNPGSIEQPLESIQQAQSLVSKGDTVYIRGGIYTIHPDQISRVQQGLFACITFLNKSGGFREGETIKYWAYPGETPVFDFSDVKPANQRVVGIWVEGSFIHIKGLEMTGVQVTITEHTESYCIYSSGNNNIFEQISMYDNKGTGLRHRRGGNNLFLNCDAYRNHDDVSENKLGSNTDGFGCHPGETGTGNVFRGCRAWFNSDDGFDTIRSGAPVVFENCWAFYNGYSTSFSSLGDGNGFKAGGYAYDPADQIPSPVPRNTIQFCVAVRNKANGFYSNHHLAGNDWYNNSAYQNSTNFNMVNRESPQSDNIWVNGYDHVLKNNLSYEARSSETAYIDPALNTLANNSFDLPIIITDDDFISLDENLLISPRKPDGSLPDIDFMRPAQGSDIIDAGVDIGSEFLGDAPELGAFEVDYSTNIAKNEGSLPEELTLFQNYPNPFNPKTTIEYKVGAYHYTPLHVDLSIYNILGQKVAILVSRQQPAGNHRVEWNAGSMAGGVYFYRIQAGDFVQTRRMLLIK